jgi:tRNA 5-methylaminomethyl-2-thiouridine biosynthesis bifunctional protein
LREEGAIRHPVFDDVYFHPADGLAEAQHVFLRGNELAERFARLPPNARFVLGETGFGTGRAAIAAIQLFEAVAPSTCQLVVHSTEAYPLDFATASAALQRWPDLHRRHAQLEDGWPDALPGLHDVPTGNARIHLLVWVGDTAETLRQTTFDAEAWFLDGFAPAKNPEMWSDAVFEGLVHNSASGATFATYTAAGRVRRGLQAVGFAVEKVAGFGTKRHMLRGRFTGSRRVRRWDRVSARYPVLPPRRCARVAVVGGGIAGAAVARELASAGVEVRVFEKDRVASGASGNPAALIEPMLGDANNVLARWVNQGFLAARTAIARWALPAQVHWSTHAGPRAAVQRQKIEACGHPDWVRATADGIQLRSLVVSPVEWVRTLLDHPRIAVREGVTVSSLDGAALGADAVVLANSAAAAELAPQLPLSWVRGQLAWSDSPLDLPGPLCASRYVLPAVHGRQVWGATFAPGDTDMRLRDADVRAIVADLAAAFPSLPANGAMDGGRVSLRGVSNGRLPLVGPLVSPGEAERTRRGDGRPVFAASAVNPDVWVSVGHGSRGFCSAFAAAWVVAQAIGGGPHRVPRRLASAVHPGRVVLSRSGSASMMPA